MKGRIAIACLAAAGFVFALYSARATSQVAEPEAPLVEPATSPFAQTVAGLGVVEASTQNIELSAPVGGVVKAVFVEANQTIQPGQKVFELDGASQLRVLEMRKADLESAEANLKRLQALPRPEDLKVLEAKLAVAEAQVRDAEAQLQLRASVANPRAISRDERSRFEHAAEIARAQRDELKEQWKRESAGAWDADIAVAKAQVGEAEALVRAALTDLDRLTIRAPFGGTCLRVRVQPGEYLQPGGGEGAIVLGSTQDLLLRVEIDQEDAWRVKQGADAVASMRGVSQHRVDLEFVRVEPYIQPKKNLAQSGTERVDTRVLEVMYRFKNNGESIYVGQQMDVYIEAQEPAAQALSMKKKS
jgi:multidrug resistance efflux pump